jgi:hypothetical protein
MTRMFTTLFTGRLRVWLARHEVVSDDLFYSAHIGHTGEPDTAIIPGIDIRTRPVELKGSPELSSLWPRDCDSNASFQPRADHSVDPPGKFGEPSNCPRRPGLFDQLRYVVRP